MAQLPVAGSPRERIDFNSGWRFCRGDAPDAGTSLDYEALRPWLLAAGTELINDGVSKPVRPPGNPGAKVSFVQPSFDDANWRKLDLPHDWGIEGPFAQELAAETGKLLWQGTGWYRRRFFLPKREVGRRIAPDIDGAMAFSAVWLNGQFAGGWPYGYSSFRLDLTPWLRFDGDNVLAIRLYNRPESSRWYPGSGLYRNVWLVKMEAVRLAHWGVFVTTPRVTRQSAVVNVDVTLENDSDEEAELTVETAIYELNADGALPGRKVAEAEAFSLELRARATTMRTPRTCSTSPIPSSGHALRTSSSVLGASACRHGARISASSISPGFPRTASACTRHAGVPASKWLTSCPTGTGPRGLEKSLLFTSTRLATRQNYSSMAGLSADAGAESSSTGSAGTTWSTNPASCASWSTSRARSGRPRPSVRPAQPPGCS
jgi:hypothetical protein